MIDTAFLDCSWYGSRQMARHLRRNGGDVGGRSVQRLMAKIGLTPIYQRPHTSDPYAQHRIYPYLLRKPTIKRPSHVWCADVTYVPMRRGFRYLVAIMGWATGKVLAWRLSNTMDAGFCVAALEEALTQFSKPEIFNTDQRPSLRHKPSPAYCATPRRGSPITVPSFRTRAWPGVPRWRPTGESGNQIMGGMPHMI